MAQSKNIGILTGGGDVPGLNSIIKSVVYRATEMGHSVTGIRKGWKGLTNMNQADTGDDRLDRQLTRKIRAPLTAAAAPGCTPPAPIRVKSPPTKFPRTSLPTNSKSFPSTASSTTSLLSSSKISSASALIASSPSAATTHSASPLSCPARDFP